MGLRLTVALSGAKRKRSWSPPVASSRCLALTKRHLPTRCSGR